MTTHYTTLASDETLETLANQLSTNGFLPSIVSSREEALALIRTLIPEGASVMNGSSRTLEQIGLIDVLKTKDHTWNNLHDGILAETDEAKQAELRSASVNSDYYLGSAHAVTKQGELVIASASGSQLPHLVYTSQNIILVVGTQKIVPNLQEARGRILEHVFPLEDERMKSVGYPGSVFAKELIIHNEPAMMGRKFHIILVKEELGF